MHVVRLKDAVPYYPAEHNDMRCLRLQGHEAGPADQSWVGMSQLLPGGHTSLGATGVEKFYVVLEGELTIENGSESVVLRQWDSVRIAPGEKRALKNETMRPAVVLLTMPLQGAAKG